MLLTDVRHCFHRAWRPLSLAALAVTSSATFAQGYAPDVAAAKMTLPDDLEVSLFASEPLVRQPVAIEFDDRGRLWVVQYLQYPNPSGPERVTVDRYSRTKYNRLPKPPPQPLHLWLLRPCDPPQSQGRARGCGGQVYQGGALPARFDNTYIAAKDCTTQELRALYERNTSVVDKHKIHRLR